MDRLSPTTPSVAVIIPARNEASTIADVIVALDGASSAIDELVVIDDHSSDDTARIAERLGAKVVFNDGLVGKGAAMQLGVDTTTSDVIVFLDADVTSTSARYVTSLVQPLFDDDQVILVKGDYDRPIGSAPTGGGRVTELTVRPALSALFPELASISQPIAGETAVRREALKEIQLAQGYDVEIALLLDVYATYGRRAIGEIDLGVRCHRNRPLSELSPMATVIMSTIINRWQRSQTISWRSWVLRPR